MAKVALHEILRVASGRIGALEEWAKTHGNGGLQQAWNDAVAPGSMLTLLTLSGDRTNTVLAMLVALEYVADQYEPKARTEAAAIAAILTEEVAQGLAPLESVLPVFATFVSAVQAHRFMSATSDNKDGNAAMEDVGVFLANVVREVVPTAPKVEDVIKGLKQLRIRQRGLRMIRPAPVVLEGSEAQEGTDDGNGNEDGRERGPVALGPGAVGDPPGPVADRGGADRAGDP